jgi:hypothetical protein
MGHRAQFSPGASLFKLLQLLAPPTLNGSQDHVKGFENETEAWGGTASVRRPPLRPPSTWPIDEARPSAGKPGRIKLAGYNTPEKAAALQHSKSDRDPLRGRRAGAESKSGSERCRSEGLTCR